MSDPQPIDVAIRDDSIRLGQFLKLANLVDHGSEAKPLVTGGQVRVNGEVELRRGRQLVVGDVVQLLEADSGDAAGQAVRVATGDVPDDLPW